ncbi:L,D-transpeptidase family protein [Anaerobacillus alkaliphilus]|uniref:L,D-transpeptidase family protein n=1 Tax=Anaerobacillus alkaliphilus TaxID=1548597 RepID=UPI0019D559E2|nr:stalk domain-containing protein [Anaerobacillus alkaliphilus]
MRKGVILAFLISLLVCVFPYEGALASQGQGQLIIINKSTNQLGYFNNGELVRTFAVATGRSDSLTPEGSFTIVNKIKNRPYYKDGIPGGDPRNPLGDRWLGLDARGTYGTTYAIHGNNNPDSIGKYVSAGCVRMHNEDVHWLFDQLNLYTPVNIGHFSADFEEAARKVGYELRQPIEVFVNGELLSLENSPKSVNNRVLVPLRAIFSSLGAKVTWDQKTQSVTAIRGDRNIKLTIGSTKAYINGQETILDVPAEVYNGSTYVPIRFVSEALGAKINWDNEKRVIAIETETAPVVATSVDLKINGKLNPFEQRAYLRGGTAMVPLRGIFQELGAQVTWNQEEAVIYAQKGDRNITLYLNESIVFVNQVAINLAVPAEIIAGTTFIPARFISETFNVPIHWDPTLQLVTIM